MARLREKAAAGAGQTVIHATQVAPRVQATRLWFARHGEVAAPYVGSWVGTTDVPLSDLGRHQAEALGAYLEDAPIDAIVASPRKRALDTAAPLAKRLGQKLEVRKSLAEMHYGAWEGLHWPEIVARDPDAARQWQEDPGTMPCPGGGESCDGFQARIQAALAELRAEFAGRCVALFAHAGVNRAILGDVLERRFVDCFVFTQDYGCLNAAAWTDGVGGQIAMVNFVPGPRSTQTGD